MSKKILGLCALLLVLGLSLLLANCGSSSSRPSGLLYVLSQGDSTIGSYAINLNNGQLSLINNKALTCPSGATCGLPLQILLDSMGASALVLNQGLFDPGTGNNPPTPPSGIVPSINGYTVNSDGSLALKGDLTSQPAPPVSGACNQAPQGIFTPCDLAIAMAMDSSGKFLFVITQGNQALNQLDPLLNNLQPQLYVFSIQAGSSSLTLASQKALTRVPTSIAAATVGSRLLLYITSNQDLLGGAMDNVVSEWSVDQAGTATELIGSPYAVGTDPRAVLAVQTAPVGGSGQVFVYVANAGSSANNIDVFQVCTVLNGGSCLTQDEVDNAKLVPVGNPVQAGLAPIAMTVDPTKNFLYVVNHGGASVSAFRINLATGALSPLNPASVSTGSGPMGIAMHSSGKYLFVSNNSSSSVSGFSVDTTSGQLSNAINVTSSAQPSGIVAK